jgi:hypothetical protein
MAASALRERFGDRHGTVTFGFGRHETATLV